MRHACALLLGLLSVLPVGCFSSQTVHKTAWLERGPFVPGPVGDDLVVMYVAVLEVPIGDHFINEELWTQADEQVVALERKPVLEDNGLRIAQLSGIIPPRLLKLLTSDRSCINPHRLLLHAGDESTIRLGPSQPRCEFELHANGRETPVALEKAECVLAVKPALTRDGKTRVTITPKIQHGETTMRPRPAKDPSGVYSWELHEERPTESYSALSWEITLVPNEYVVVGARYDRLNTLGQQFFICRDEQAPVQRLLAIRISRSMEAVASSASDAEEDDTPRSPPVALQASLVGAPGQ